MTSKLERRLAALEQMAAVQGYPQRWIFFTCYEDDTFMAQQTPGPNGVPGRSFCGVRIPGKTLEEQAEEFFRDEF